MEGLANEVAEMLRVETGESDVVGVSYYTEETVGHVYRSDWAADYYTEEQIDEIVEDLRMASVGHGAVEARHEQNLHATVRVYDDVLDVAVPVGEWTGVAFALAVDGDYDVRDVVEDVERIIDESHHSRTVAE